MGEKIKRTLFILMRLYHNQAGNTLAMVAAAIIPLLGLVGGGVDMSRIYLTKTRLQQACDAGALAGRKQMGAGAWSASNAAANNVALSLFNANFQDGSYGTNGRTINYTESGGKVTGAAAVNVPMTIMRIFGQTNKAIVTTCEAEMRIPNSDIMFVLDNTGSMGSTNSGDTDTKINGLKKAVKCFYEALAKLDTDADCGSVPSTANASQVQLRFGFVPYDVNVKVGRLLHNDWMVDRWAYQTRIPVLDPSNPTLIGGPTTSSTTWGSYSNFGTSTTVANKTACDDTASAQPVPADTITSDANTPLTYTGNFEEDIPIDQVVTFNNIKTYNTTSFKGSYTSSGKKCQLQSRNGSYSVTTKYTNFRFFRLKQEHVNVSALKAGGWSWNNSITLPVGTAGTYANSTWDGCVEERQTWVTDNNPADDYSPIPSSAYDLNIDLVPSGDTATRWAPMLDDLVWGRQDSSGDNTLNTVDMPAPSNYSSPSSPSRIRAYSCPVAEARKLAIYSSAGPFDSYVDTMTPGGNTYHDIGLIWGARLLSPTGLFASENATTPQGGEIQRHLIFMTDGDTVTDVENLTPQGVPWWDRRQSAPGSAPTNSLMTANVNARTQAICTAIKNMNITLWVISFGSGVSSSVQTALKNCATSTNHYFMASNSQQLIDQFKQIADNISQLRLTN